MSFYEKFSGLRDRNHNVLCVGLDPQWEKLPAHIRQTSEPLLHFCQVIVDQTYKYVTSYKINIAFFERFGSEGISQFEKLTRYIRLNYDSIPIIGDVKRGDLANTAKEYAEYYFSSLQLDAITVSPYMGRDSLRPFLGYKNSFLFSLCLTSNPGSADLQARVLQEPAGQKFYQASGAMIQSLGQEFPEQLGLVVGATHPDELAQLRADFPELPFLIPGVGAQGGSVAKVLSAAGRNSIINSSRKIIFAGGGDDFGFKAGQEAKQANNEMVQILTE